MLRTLVERVSRKIIFKRKLKRFNSTPLYVSPDSQLKYLKPGEDAFDTELLDVIDWHIHADSIVWDIGANIGVFTFGAAAVARQGHVLAVEADIWLAQLIKKSQSIKQNGNLKISILPAAISNNNGVATFLIAQRGRASNSLESTGGRSQAGGVRNRVHIPTLTLDTLLDHFSAPTFIKIDVEGAETMVLEGATKILSEIRPVIYIEVGSKENEAVTSMLKNNNYMLYDGSRPLGTQTPRDDCVFNTIAVPDSQK